jgi:hypothetical protein
MSIHNLEHPPTKIKKKVCFANKCRRKLNLVDLQMECKCKNSYCSKHRHCESHNCTYINIIENNEIIKKRIDDLRCVAPKLLQI